MDIKLKSIPLENILGKQNTKSLKPYLCSSCNEIPLEPLLCDTCDTYYCAFCIETELREICDLCQKKQEYRDGSKFFNIFFKKLTFACKYSQSGCKESIPYSQLKDHLANCQYQQFQCSCGEQIFTNEAENHEEICPETVIHCEDCGVSLPRKAMNDHMNKCNERLLSCKDCGVIFKQKDLQRHQVNCKNLTEDLIRPSYQSRQQETKNEDYLLSLISELNQTLKSSIIEMNKKVDYMETRLNSKLNEFDNRIRAIERRSGMTDTINSNAIYMTPSYKPEEEPDPQYLNTHHLGFTGNSSTNVKSTLRQQISPQRVSTLKAGKSPQMKINFNTHKSSSDSSKKLGRIVVDNNLEGLDNIHTYQESRNFNTGTLTQMSEQNDRPNHRYVWNETNNCMLKNLTGEIYTTTCEIPLIKNDKVSVKIIRLSDPYNFAIGITNKLIFEDSSGLLGLDYNGGNWALLGSGDVAEEGEIRKLKGSDILKPLDIITINIDNGYIMFAINREVINYGYKIGKDMTFYLACSTRGMGDTIQVVDLV